MRLPGTPQKENAMKTPAIVSCLLVLVHASLASAADLLVPSQYSTIQAAVNAAADGDRVLVAPGTYNEQVTINAKQISVIGTQGPTVTKIDRAGASNTTFVCTNFAAGQLVIVEGITVTRCNSDAFTMTGGTLKLVDVRVLSGSRGVQLVGSTARLEGLRYQAVVMNSQGAGVYLPAGASANLVDCAFSACNGQQGAAVFGSSGNSVELAGTSFSNCTSVSGAVYLGGAGVLLAESCIWFGCSEASNGACLYLTGQGTAELRHCEFRDNAGSDIYSSATGRVLIEDAIQTGGRGNRYSFLRSTTGPVEITRLISINSGGYVDSNGQGGWLRSDGGAVSLTDCDFTGFSASGSPSIGGGIVFATGGASPVTIQNCNVELTSVESGGQSGVYVHGRPLLVSDTEFRSATADVHLYKAVGCTSNASTTVERSTFQSNRQTTSVYAENCGACSIVNCEFVKPSFNDGNHFVYLNGSTVRSDVVIEGTRFSRGSYAVYQEQMAGNSTMVVRNCEFIDGINSPSAIRTVNVSPSIYDCLFRNNQGYSVGVGSGQYAMMGGNYFCGSQVAELGPLPIVVKYPNVFSADCAADCDLDGAPDDYEVAAGLDTDCNANGVPDSCDADSGSDCNNNGTPDACDLADGTAADCNLNGVPDSCEPDCDRDGTPDACEIAGGATDCDGNGVPDSCQADCDGDGVLDFCEIASGATDCDADGIPDACEIAAAQTLDFNNDGTLDACQPAMQFAGLQLEIQPIVGRGTDDLFPAGAVCYRLYARVSADAASAVGVYGNSQYPMVVNAAGGFWQSPFGGDLANEVGCNDTSALPSYRYDSWFTIGKDCALGNAVQNTGLDFTGFNSGSGINDADGLVFVAPGSPQAAGGAARRVLLAQFTTTRPVFPTGTVNVVGRSNGGSGPENAWLALGQQIPMPALVDCNGNGEHDAFDIAKGVALDCDQSGVPDTCEHPSAVTDCNSNGISDLCDCYSGFSSDINTNNVPDECECTGDIDANGVVDVDDIIWVLVSWGADGSSEADVNSDGIVNGADLAIVLQGWGQCS
jgi:hypothetical protein